MPMGNLSLPPFTRGVKWLLVIAVAVSIAVPLGGGAGQVFGALVALSPEAVLHGYVWQLFTYTFLHRSPESIIFAVLGLCLSSFLPFADSAKGRCPRSGRRGHEHRL